MSHITSCKWCHTTTTSNPKFCNRSCATNYTNRQRGPMSKENKDKRSKTLKAQRRKPITLTSCPACHCLYLKNKSKTCGKQSCKTFRPTTNKETFKICNICFSLFYGANKQCCKECRVKSASNRKNSNGSYYFCKYTQTKVWLQSSWEIQIAEYLDSKSIKWLRPSALKYTLDNKVRLYFPDFYLPKNNIYLDPKNPYCLIQDQNKLISVINQLNINLYYGKCNDIISNIKKYQW